MKIDPRQRDTWENKTFPKYFFKWQEFLPFEQALIGKFFKEKNGTMETVLSPFLRKKMPNVHRTFKQKVQRVIEDTIEAYFEVLLIDCMETGKIYELPLDYGHICLCKTGPFGIEGKKSFTGMFVVINSPKIDALSRKKLYTKIHARNFQLHREAWIRVNEHPEKYHTVESFKEQFDNTLEKLQILANI